MRVTRDPWKPSHSTRMVGGALQTQKIQNSIPSFFISFDLKKVIKPLGLDFLAYKTCLGTNEAYKYLLKSPMHHICVDWVRTSALASHLQFPALFMSLTCHQDCQSCQGFSSPFTGLSKASCILNYRSVAKC